MTPHRREFLRTSAAAGLALAAGSRSPATPAPVGRAKSCIVLMLTGGPSQLDTWDPKPDAASNVRSPFAPIRTRVPGVQVTELFPKMAAMADKFALVRTLHHEYAPIHENGFQLLNTGRRFGDGPAWPSVGSVVAHLREQETGSPTEAMVIPTVAVDSGVGVDQGFGTTYLGRPPKLWPRAGKFSAISDKFRPHFGKTRFGEDCMWASMLSHPGPGSHPVVTVSMYQTVFDSVSWDCHADGGSLSTTLADYCDSVAPTFDMAFTGLLTELEQSGRLDETLVVAVGEFGRTPKRNANGGRDHWPGSWTAILAGGGVRGGQLVGRSDATGSEPADRPVTCPELVATIYHALGIPPATPIPGPDGHPASAVEAEPIGELF